MKDYRVSSLLSVALLLPILLSNQSSAVAAEVKSGSSCAKYGSYLTVKALKYVCVRSGKKLTWIKATSLDPYSDTQLEIDVSNEWAKWRANKLDKKFEIIFKVQDGYSEDWVKYSEPTINYLRDVLDGNGLQMVTVPYIAFGETEEWRKSVFLNMGCNPPYMPNEQMAIYCARADIGSGGIRIGKPNQAMANGYRLNDLDKKLLSYFNAHELGIFYEVQAEYHDSPYTGLLNQIPSWVREGTAQMIGLMVSNDIINKGGSYNSFKADERMFGTKPNGLCPKDLQDYEGKNKFMPDQCTMSQNFYAVQLLVAKHGGFKALFNFPKYLGEEFDWPSDFKQAFGISREDFYHEWYTYLGLREDRFPIIREPTPGEHY